MKTHVEFRSEAFARYENEEDEINPGRYGKRLAEFLASGLKQKGFAAQSPVAEDWGWVVPIENDGFRLWIGCGNYDQYPGDGYLCFIEPHQPRIRRWLLWTIDTSAKISTLREAIDQLLSMHPSVRNKKWWTHDEFNHPAEPRTTR